MNVDKFLMGMIGALRRKLIEWIPLICVSSSQQAGLMYRHFDAGGWTVADEGNLPAHTPLSHTVLLVEDQHCVFQYRHFPVEFISADGLDEAVELDFEQWVPFFATHAGKVEVDWLACAERDGDQWHVAVWVWPAQLSEQLLADLPSQLSCTHLMPRSAWHVALARVSEPTLLIVAAGDSQTLIMLDDHGLPLAMSCPGSAAEARRFWRSQAAAGSDVKTALCFDPDIEPVWLPPGCRLQCHDPGLPRYSVLSRARRPGVRDWSDPLSWKKPIAAAAVLLVVWMLSYTLMLNLRSDAIDELAAQTKSQVQEVLQARENIGRIQAQLNSIQHLQLRQAMPLQQLAALAEVLPDDVWIEMFRMQGEWVDLRGKGRHVDRLLVLLESIEGVTSVELLNDIRPDIKTGLEQFQLRLFFAMPDAGDDQSDMAGSSADGDSRSDSDV